MESKGFSLHEVLAVARIHPFYAAQVPYPPDSEAVRGALESTASESVADFHIWPLTTKKDLYKVIERLTGDTSPQNTYRDGSYLSITGGGCGGLPMLFATDALENRAQRARMGDFIRTCGVIESGDWVLTTHSSGHFYRSLDLTLEILENAGASVLSAGNYMGLAEVTTALAHYRGNVLSGDGSQVIRVIHYISTLPKEEQQRIKLDKIIYTSEPLTPAQRSYVALVLGSHVKICSLLGSSEAGPWALSCPSLTGDGHLEVAGAADFVFDTRTMLIEILDPSSLEGDDEGPERGSEALPDGSPGIIVQTSLQRLKNPLVRYVTGDIGSLHPLPESAVAAGAIPLSELKHFRILRLHGRDQRFSFKWYGIYYEFDKLAALMQTEEWKILQWQVILATLESSRELTLEARILLPSSNVGGDVAAEPRLVKAIENYFVVLSENRHLFRLNFVKDLTEFERSSTGGKVMHFVDRVH